MLEIDTQALSQKKKKSTAWNSVFSIIALEFYLFKRKRRQEKDFTLGEKTR